MGHPAVILKDRDAAESLATRLRLILAENPHWRDLSLDWEEDFSWAAEPEAEFRPVLKKKKKKKLE